MGVTICGTGCSLMDYLYTDVSFSGQAFRRYQSRKEGDGGLQPGKLVFARELEEFAGKRFAEILTDIVGDRPPDARNLGGPAVVALIHAAQLTEGRDVGVRFYGVRGEDPSASAIEEIVRGTPIDVARYESRPGQTPFTNVLSDPTYDDGHGERTFVNALGVAAEYAPDDIEDSFFDSDIALFGGTALVPRLHDGLTGLLRRSRDGGAVTVVSTVYDFRAEKRNPSAPWPLGDTAESLPLIDLLVTDREEALRLSGATDIETAVRSLVDGGVHTCVVTQGSSDVALYADGSVFAETPLVYLPVSLAVRQQIAGGTARAGDTTGCGDNFVGGMLASLALQLQSEGRRSLDLKEACSWAIASGGYTCFYIGGTYLEERAGEKRKLIEPYYEAYRDQIGLTR